MASVCHARACFAEAAMEPAPRSGSRAAHGWLTAAIICVHVEADA